MKIENRECVHCLANKKKLDSDLWFMVALEKPYDNLWFHRECYKLYTEDELIEFLVKNANIWHK